jgi:hypothetical protein
MSEDLFTQSHGITFAGGGLLTVLIGLLAKLVPKFLRNGRTERERALEARERELEDKNRALADEAHLAKIKDIMHEEGELTRKEMREGFAALSGELRELNTNLVAFAARAGAGD